jgi:hypothetical protein
MTYADITREPLFNSLLEFNIEGQFIDIHNDFQLENILYDNEFGLFQIILKSEALRRIEIRFEQALITKMAISPLDDTVDNLYRGRYEYREELFETYDGKSCFYIDFTNGSSINLLCERAFVSW